MKYTYGYKTLCRTALVLAAAAVSALSTAAFANVDAVITKHNGQSIRGQVTWKGSMKVYSVKNADGVVFQVPARDVRRVMPVTPPSGLKQAISNVRAGRPAAAISTLESIRKKYARMHYDVIATEWLAEAYYKNNNAPKAIDVIEGLMDSGGSLSAKLMDLYSKSLMKKKDFEKLKRVLTSIIETGSREAAAIAQVKRADIDRERGDNTTALVDGYLRTIVLYREVEEIQPEAVYKAMLAFKDRGQHTHAEKMRKILLEQYPGSSYSQKVRTD